MPFARRLKAAQKRREKDGKKRTQITADSTAILRPVHMIQRDIAKVQHILDYLTAVKAEYQRLLSNLKREEMTFRSLMDDNGGSESSLSSSGGCEQKRSTSIPGIVKTEPNETDDDSLVLHLSDDDDESMEESEEM